MSTQVQHRRGTNAENEAFTGAVGEFTFDTTNKRIVAHDGTTAGGLPAPNYKDVQNQTFRYAAGTLSTGVYSVTLAKTPGSYVTGLQITIVPGSNNTGACDVNVNGMGAKDINKDTGSGTLVELSADDMRANIPYDLFYNGTKFILRSGGSSSTPPTRQVFTSSGTWTKPSGCRFIIVTVSAGGGGSSGSNGSGGVGGTSSFATHASATGGNGGTNTSVGSNGVGSLGDYNITSAAYGGFPGMGHGAPIGSSITAGQLTDSGNHGGVAGVSVVRLDATAFTTKTVTVGSAGSAGSSGGNSSIAGAPGGAGIVIVEEFY